MMTIGNANSEYCLFQLPHIATYLYPLTNLIVYMRIFTIFNVVVMVSSPET
jgi:hypothetical protein